MEDQGHSMQTDITQSRDLTYLTIYPQEYDPELTYPVIILLHGFGANMYDLADLSSVIGTNGYVYVCPNAPIPVQLAPGMVGFAWTEPGTNNPEQFLSAERKLSVLFQDVSKNHKISTGNALLMGFSQGGSMTYRCGLLHPEMFSGLVALSCSIRDQDEMRDRLPIERDQQIFIAHGLRDNIERAQSTRAFLESEGYAPIYREYDMAHEISQEVISDLIPWIHRVLPPLHSIV